MRQLRLDSLGLPAVIAFAAFLAAAGAAAAASVDGTFAIEGRAVTITDVSAHRLNPDGENWPAWELVFSERPHEHTAAGRERALDGDHGVAFTVEVLASGEGHNFVLYERKPGATTAFPSSFAWPQVSAFAVEGSTVRGRVGHNPDFPFGGMRFDLSFTAPIAGK